MIVKCIENRCETLQSGRLYIVYAMFVANEVKWYFLRLREETWYPVWCRGCLFETVDDTPSRYWVQTPLRYWEQSDEFSHITGSSDEGMLYAFYEFTENDNFYDNLIEKCEEEVEVFKQIVQKIKDEAIY
jgi:hypothetical protein